MSPLRISSFITSLVLTRANPRLAGHNTGPCRISLRTMKRSGLISAGGASSLGVPGSSEVPASFAAAASTDSSGGDASSCWVTSPAAAASSALLMSASTVAGFIARIQGPNTSNVTTCSDRNQPEVHLRSTMLRYGASWTSRSSPALTRASATLPKPHGATPSSNTSTMTRMTIFFKNISLRISCPRQLGIEGLQPLDGTDVVPAAGVQFATQFARRDRPTQQRQQREFSGRTTGEKLRAIDANSGVRMP